MTGADYFLAKASYRKTCFFWVILAWGFKIKRISRLKIKRKEGQVMTNKNIIRGISHVS